MQRRASPAPHKFDRGYLLQIEQRATMGGHWRLLALATVLIPACSAQQLDCRYAPDQGRGYLAGPCDCFCPDSRYRVNATAHTVRISQEDTVTCGELLSDLSQEVGGCEEAVAAASGQGYAVAQLAADCCVALTLDNPLDAADYCGGTPRGVCDLPLLASALEGLMVEETSTTVESFLLTRLDRGAFCSCYRLFMQLKQREVDLPVEGECIGTGGIVCPSFRPDYVCSGREIASIEGVSDAGDCGAWCMSAAAGATQTCCMQIVGDLGAFCALGAFAVMEPVAESAIGEKLSDHLPNLNIGACELPEPRIGDDVAGRSAAFDMLYRCFDGLLAGMLVQPTTEMVAQVCPGDFVRCQAAAGCIEELWSHLRNFGACNDRDLADAMGKGPPGVNCLARVCPAEINACWPPGGTAECTAGLTSALANGQEEMNPAEMPPEMLAVYMCFVREQIRYRHAPCVDRQTCSEQIYADLYCQQEFQINMMITGDIGAVSPCSSESLTTECLQCVMEYSGEGGGGDGAGTSP